MRPSHRAGRVEAGASFSITPQTTQGRAQRALYKAWKAASSPSSAGIRASLGSASMTTVSWAAVLIADASESEPLDAEDSAAAAAFFDEDAFTLFGAEGSS